MEQDSGAICGVVGSPPPTVVRSQGLDLDSPSTQRYWKEDLRTLELQVDVLQAYLRREKEKTTTLSQQLGATEYELGKSRASLKQSETDSHRHDEEMEEKMGAAAEETARVRSECERMRKESVRLGDRLAEMERYLIMLPTEKEHRATTRKLRTLVEERDIERRHLEAARGELATAARRETDKDDAMARLREELGERDGQIAALRARIERAAEEEAVNREGTPETLAEMRKRIGMLSGELAKYRKVFAVKHSKDTRQLEQHQRTIHELRERQQQEDSALVGTRAELNAREADLRQLRGSKREVVQQNQQLMQDNLTLKERVAEMVKLYCGEEASALHARLQGELGACVGDVTSLVRVLSQIAANGQPDLSLLLGTQGSSSAVTGTTLGRLDAVLAMREQLREAQAKLTSDYAGHLADSMTCRTQ